MTFFLLTYCHFWGGNLQNIPFPWQYDDIKNVFSRKKVHLLERAHTD